MGVVLALMMMVQTPTDWEFARQTVAEMLEDIQGLPDIESALLYDVRYSSDDAGYLIRNQLTEVLRQQGVEVYYSSPLEAEPDVELRYLVNELRVVHKRSYRRFLLGRRMIERWAQADVQITLIKDNRVISQQRLLNQAKSVFPESQVDLVRCSLTEEYYTSSSAGSLWEPLLVTALVGVLIYIFYAPTD